MKMKFKIDDIVRYNGNIYQITDIETAKHSYVYNVKCLKNNFPDEPVCASIGSAAEDKMELADFDKPNKNLWKPADGDDLPEIDREVVVLLSNGKVAFGHRPKESWTGKNIDTGEVTTYYPKRYDKGGWNIPDVKYWLDCELPNIE